MSRRGKARRPALGTAKLCSGSNGEASRVRARYVPLSYGSKGGQRHVVFCFAK